jgi:quinohemoprotein ethanol dehydrogenase
MYVEKGVNTGSSSMFGDMLMTTADKVPPAFRDVFTKAKESGNVISRTVIKAFDPKTGETVWEQEGDSIMDRGGLLSTAGDLVFQGSDTGYFRAWNARTGERLLNIKIGTTIMAAPMSYMVDGVQYVSVMAAFGGGGWNVPAANSAARIYGNEGRILTFKLDGGEVEVPEPLPPVGPIPEPPVTTDATPAEIAHGAALFGNCMMCHANDPRGGTPDLRRMTADTHAHFKDIVLNGTRREQAMPQWDDLLSEKDAEDIHAYLIDLSWKAYKAQETGTKTEQKTEPGRTAQ